MIPPSITRLFLLLLFLFNTIVGFAFDTNAQFGIKKQTNPDNYQQYVGQKFYFRESMGIHETWDNSGFKYKENYKGKLFVIESISVKEETTQGKTNKKVSLVATEVNGKKKVKFHGYENSIERSLLGNSTMYPLIGNMPIVFLDPFEAYKNKLIGKNISDPLVKDNYSIVDISIGLGSLNNYSVSTICAQLKNNRTGEHFSCPYTDIDIAPFKEALKGQYCGTLIKVEKNDNSTKQQSNSEITTNTDTDQKRYQDSIINILISTTSEQFDFTLENISPYSIKIIWNEAAFVGLDGSSSKIMHTGTKYSQREADQPATVIIKNAKIEDVAVPTANIYYDEGLKIGYSTIGNGWKKRSMFPENFQGREIGVVRLMLPIQVKDVTNEYTFIFKVSYVFQHPELLNLTSTQQTHS